MTDFAKLPKTIRKAIRHAGGLHNRVPGWYGRLRRRERRIFRLRSRGWYWSWASTVREAEWVDTPTKKGIVVALPLKPLAHPDF